MVGGYCRGGWSVQRRPRCEAGAEVAGTGTSPAGRTPPVLSGLAVVARPDFVECLSGYTLADFAGAAQDHHEDGGEEHEAAHDEHRHGVAAGQVLEPAGDVAGTEAREVAHGVDEGDACRRCCPGEELGGHGPEV